MSIICEAWRLSQTDTLDDYINSEYTRETRCASRQVLKANRNCESNPIISDCIKLLNHPKLAPVRSFNDIDSIRNHVFKCIDHFPI